MTITPLTQSNFGLLDYVWNEGVIIAVVIAIKAIATKPEKCFRGFNGIRTHGLCVSAAVHQLSYEDPYVGSGPICWIHRNRERNETYNIILIWIMCASHGTWHRLLSTWCYVTTYWVVAANSPASLVACLWESLKYAGTVTTASVTFSPR